MKKKATIILTCTHCGNEFEKDKNEYTRRLHKLPGNQNFFCTRSCSAKYRNARYDSTAAPPPQHGNAYAQRYPLGTGWYVGRCAKDHRFPVMTQEQRDALGIELMEVWNKQAGRCAFTGLDLIRRTPMGKCSEDNPFKIASVDRIDCSRPYERGNVQWVSYAMNLARNDLPSKVFGECVKELLG